MKIEFYALVQHEIYCQPGLRNEKIAGDLLEMADRVFTVAFSVVLERLLRAASVPNEYIVPGAIQIMSKSWDVPSTYRNISDFLSTLSGSNYDSLCRSALLHLAWNDIKRAEDNVNIAKLNHDDRAFAHHVYGLLRGLQGDEAGARFELYLALQRETYEDAKRRIECALRVLDTVRTPNHASAMLPR